MSASQNPDSLDNQGEFSSKVAASEPMTTKGHAPGVKVGNDAVPEFSAETHPPGTAPRENTFHPNPVSETPGQALNVETTTRTDPLDFGATAATSGTIHNATEFGRPMQGQTSAEQHGSKKKDRTGVEGRITSGNPSAETGDGSVESKVRGAGADLEGRAGELKGQKGYSGAAEGGSKVPGAEEALPASAEEVASELR